jgi:hypothetical protein
LKQFTGLGSLGLSREVPLFAKPGKTERSRTGKSFFFSGVAHSIPGPNALESYFLMRVPFCTDQREFKICSIFLRRHDKKSSKRDRQPRGAAQGFLVFFVGEMLYNLSKCSIDG